MIPEPLTQQPNLETRSQALFEEWYPWSHLQNSAVAITPSTLLAALCPGPASRVCHPPTHTGHQLTSSPTRRELVPYNTSLPCSLHTDGHSLVQMAMGPACPQPPPQHLKALKSLFKLLPPTGTFQATPHSPPEATGDPDLFRRDLFPTWERWDKVVPAVTPLSTLTCSWVLF